MRGGRDAFQPLTHHGQRVFGREEQHRSAAPDMELSQAGGAGSDADGDIQSHEAFAAFGFAAQDADGLLGPESFDQPLSLRAGAGQLAGPLNRVGGSRFFGGLGIQGENFEVEFFVDHVTFLLTSTARRSLAMFISRRRLPAACSQRV